MLTAGESHGPALVGILEGLPANFPVNAAKINEDLKRRHKGFGRGGRQSIENDEIEFLAGLRGGLTLGSPVAFLVKNRDYANWQEYMDPEKEPASGREITKPRPGHADLSGGLKYGFGDLRNVTERSSARETAVRAAAGSICSQLLSFFKIEAKSHVLSIGKVSLSEKGYTFQDLARAETSPVSCIDESTGQKMMREIRKAEDAGDSLGGSFEVIIRGVPAGLGSYAHWDRKLDARLAYALMSIQGIKGVEVGAGFSAAAALGSAYHDEIFHSKDKGFYRKSNRAGGIEGGVSNGEDLVLRAAMKPIPTLRKPLATVDIKTKKAGRAAVERADTTAVPAAAVVGELVALTVLAEAFLEVYGADTLEEMKKRWAGSR